ncbi:MAG TPA: HDIG domain-containing protein, partial [Chloroflexota bacterium]
SVMQKLSALGLQSRRTGWEDVLGSALFSVVIVLTLFWYLRAFHAPILTNPRLLLLIDASILGAVIGARLLGANHILLPYFLPVAGASTFAAALIAPEACIAVALAMAVLAGWVVGNSFELMMYYFLTGAAGVLAIRQLRQLKEFVFAGVYISAFALVTVLAFGFVDRVDDLSALQGYVLASVFNGFVSSTLALGAFALMSSFFGVTTRLQLLELGQPSQPLLRRLMVQAPGTYNHSLILATMVEHAAEEIDADSLSAKLGALYHDIGKSINPHCFVENQLGMGNIHDELRAEESARIIRGHVSAGLRMARQYHLPRVIVDAIAEHHGTMTIAFFLHKARQENPHEGVDAALYSYPGPKPQSKETALLMLADGCESAVRAAPDHSGAKIRETVHRIISERVESGQLDECPLTLHDLDRAEHAFVAVLNGLYHPRIEYPEAGDQIVDIGEGREPAPRTGVL